MWGPLAEEAAQKVRKGSRICVQGQIKQDHWVARTGEKRSRIVVSAAMRLPQVASPMRPSFTLMRTLTL